MGCCGQNRAEFNNLPPVTRSREVRSDLPGPTGFRAALSTPTSPPNAAAERRGIGSSARPVGRAMSLRYVERNGVIVRGPASGAEYRFSVESPVQSVDVRDADALLRSGLFMRA